MNNTAIRMTKETELEIAVSDDEATVARQREIVVMLRNTGYVGGRPEKLLATFEARLAEHRKRLANLRSGLGTALRLNAVNLVVLDRSVP